MRIITDLAKIVLAGTLVVNVVTLPVYAKGESAPVQEQISVQPVVLSEEEADIINTVTEDTTTDEDVTVQEQPVTEDVTVSDNPESEEVNETEGVMTFLYEGETRTGAPVAESDGTYKPENLLRTSVVLNPGSVITINSGSDLILLSWVDPKVYQNCVIHVVNNGQGLDTTSSYNYNGTTYTFTGLGNENNPFSGKFKFDELSKATAITLGHSLFNVLSTDTTIVNSDYESISIKLVNGANTNTALLADKVVKGTADSVTWSVTISSSTNEGIVANPPVIGTIDSSCSINLSVADDSVLNDDEKTPSKLPVSGTGNIGLVCGTLNGQLTLTSLAIRAPGVNGDANTLVKVNSSDGNVGGLVGSMGSGASLTVELKVEDSDVLTFGEISTNKGNAGGLVGKADSGATINVTSGSLNVTSVTATSVTATSGSAGGIAGEATNLKISSIPNIIVPTITGYNAGGLFGSYAYSGVEGALSTISKNISGITLNGSKNAGGVIGLLENNSGGSFSINRTVNNVTLIADSGSGNTGGVIGQYSASSLSASLNMTDLSVTSSVTSGNTYGGLVGYVNQGPAYIEASGSIVTKGTANNYGGLIGVLSDNGHMLKVGKTTINNADTIKGKTTAGGIVGTFSSGVMWLADEIQATQPKCDNNYHIGNYLGKRGNTLVFSTYMPSGGWPFNQKNRNDIGSWGQVLQVYSESGLDQLLTISDHKVAVTGNGLEVNNELSFAQSALRFQLNKKGALIIENDYDLKNKVSINLSGSINLSNTGLTGFQRDDSNAEKAKVELNCSGTPTIIFPDITIYGGATNDDNAAHTRQGLFAETSSLTVNNEGNSKLTLSGSIEVSAFNKYVFIGALVAQSSGNVTANSVISNVNLTISQSQGEERLAGLVAQQNGGTVEFNNCEWSSIIKYIYNNNDTCYLGGLLARTEKGVSINVKNCTVKGSIEKTGGSESYVGGLIASLRDDQNGSWKNHLTINGLTADGVTITTNGNSKTGGILGWEWMTETADIQGVTVKNCKLNGSSAQYGGLVFKGSGYWKIHNAGIVFKSGNVFSGKSTKAETSGLLVCHGDKLDGHNNALYLEIQDKAYTIQESSVTISGDIEYFDEIIGITESEKGNGVISIATDGDIIDSNVCNTYKNIISTNYKNSNTRYYYNLDSFGAAGASKPSGNIDTPGKLVMFSVYTHCFSGLQKYFYSGTPGIITGANLDLTGYSFYPIENYQEINNAEIRFDFDGIEGKETYNKKPSDEKRQHYGMHTGVLTGKTDTADSLTVNGLTLKGTVGGNGKNYGALIRDEASGLNANHLLNIDIDNVVLDGIRIIGDSVVKPLLINKLNNYTTLDINRVTTTDKYNGMTGKAASSLIGDVGNSVDGRDIQLMFSNMILDGSEISSIFSRATFLESFQYVNAGCSGVYNFEKTEDSTITYTLGKELSNTKDGLVSGKNNGKQYWFYNAKHTDDNMICGKKADGTYNNPATFFATGYLRYVYKQEGVASGYHEIDINLMAEQLSGCGTHTDPYIITGESGGELLKTFADAISNGGSITGTWTLKMDPNVLGTTFSNESSKDDEGVHGCVEYNLANDQWTTTADVSKKNPSKAEVLAYLQNAYFKIIGSITMPEGSDWSGLGTGTYPFSGVIVGEKSAKVIITNTGTQTQYGGLIKVSQGSVVKDLTIDYSGLTSINAKSEVPSALNNASFFGGVMGWCIGGDNIIDTVDVTYSSTGVTYSESGTESDNRHLIAIGGYVGMVGGAIMSTTDSILKYGGGVVFRGDIGNGLNDDKAQNSSNYFYVNPYVGRVLDGYVLSELQSLDNTDKNYTIPTISSGTPHLSITDNTVTVQDAQGLWLLSAIANSGAGSMFSSNDLAYTVGKARTGEYKSVGNTLSGSDNDDDESYLGGTAYNSKTVSYLSRFVTGNIHNLCNNTIDIIINTDCDMSGFGNGFRGIGTGYGTNVNNNSNYRLLKIRSINGRKSDGNNAVITLAQDRKEYTEEKDTWTSIGSGLFVLLQADTTSFTASNISLTGTTGISYYSNGSVISLCDSLRIVNSNGKIIDSFDKDNRLSMIGSGMLASNLANADPISQLTIDNVNLVGTSECWVAVNKFGTGSTTAGGLIGTLWNGNKNKSTVTNAVINDCYYSYVTVNGRMSVGGLIGYANSQNMTITFSKNMTLHDIVINSTTTAVAEIGDKYQKSYGVGGIIGFIGYLNDDQNMQGQLIINNSKTPESRLTITNISVTGNLEKDTADRSNIGGLVGICLVRNDSISQIRNISLEGNVTIVGGGSTYPNSSIGGIIGSIQPNIDIWEDKYLINNVLHPRGLTMSGIRIATTQGSQVVIRNGRQIAGLIGMMVLAGNVVIDDVVLGAEDNSVTIANNYEMSYQSIAGLIGISLSSKNTKITKSKIINTKILVRGNGNRGAGLITGFVQNGPANIYLQDITMKNSTIAVDNDSMCAGLIFGKLDGNTHNIYGYNILIEDCMAGMILKSASNSSYNLDTTKDKTNMSPTTENTGLKINNKYIPYSKITGSADEVKKYVSSALGMFGGSSVNNKGTVQLVGVSLQQSNNTLPMKEYGVNPSSNSYIVRADYTGVANGIASNVTTSPSSPVSSLIEENDVTGDGASLTGKQAIGTKIREDLLVDSKLNLKHSNVSEANEYLTSKENIWSYSDFKTAGGNDFTLPDDKNFPVLVLTSTSSKEINKIVYSWISVLTNRKMYLNESGAPTSVDRFSLNVTTYEWKDGKFHPMDTSPTFEVSSNTLTLIKDSYDNQQNRFTLLDAVFTDPTGGGNTYHLYIPVIVQKVLNFRFYAAAQTGTTYDSATYEPLDELAIASNGEKITVLLGYEYDRTTSEWQTAVDNGDNLLGNFNKNIKLDAELPSDTKLTLVDRNRNNKAYTATYSSKGDNTIAFSNFSDSSNNSWSPVKLCDMLTLTAKENADGQYVKLKNETGATIRTTDGNYYKFVDESSRENQVLYKITVGNIDNPLSETYYLTIQTPSSDTGFYNNLITCPNRLGDDLFSQPTQRKKNGRWDYSRKGNENRIVFGNCFSQTVEISTGTSGNEINSSNRSISATLTSKIKFSNETAKNLYVAYAKDQSLYQCFELKMKDEHNQQKNLAGGIAITAVYSLNDEPSGLYNYVIDEQTGLFRLTYPSGIGSNTVKDLGVDQELILKASITLDFTDTAIIDQFPVKNNDESNVGIQLWTTSKLAFKENNLPYSTISTDANEDKYFYRKEFKTANLNYNTTGDVNNLGVNGKDGDSFTVNSRAIYNVSAIEQAANAKTLRYNLTLWRRNNGSGSDAIYEQINTNWLQTYLKHEDTDPGLRTEAHYVPKGSSIIKKAKENGNVSDGVYTVDIDLVNGLNKDVPIQIPVDLKVLTGSAFEAEGKQYIYANYKVQMEAVLLDEDGNDINGTIASDYIIYTNAKINYNYLKQPSGTKQSE